VFLITLYTTCADSRVAELGLGVVTGTVIPGEGGCRVVTCARSRGQSDITRDGAAGPW